MRKGKVARLSTRRSQEVKELRGQAGTGEVAHDFLSWRGEAGKRNTTVPKV